MKFLIIDEAFKGSCFVDGEQDLAPPIFDVENTRSQRDKEPTSTGAEWTTINSGGKVHILGNPKTFLPATRYPVLRAMLTSESKVEDFRVVSIALKGISTKFVIHRD